MADEHNPWRLLARLPVCHSAWNWTADRGGAGTTKRGGTFALPGGYSDVHDCLSAGWGELGARWCLPAGHRISRSGRFMRNRIRAHKGAGPGPDNRDHAAVERAAGRICLERPGDGFSPGRDGCDGAEGANWNSPFHPRSVKRAGATDALIFAAALVVLPLVPDRYVGPFNAINPRPRNAGGVAEARGGGAFPFTARWACPRCAGGDIGTALRRNN